MDSRTSRVDSHCGHPAVVQGQISVSPVFLTKKSQEESENSDENTASYPFRREEMLLYPNSKMGHKTDHREPPQNMFVVYSKAAGIMLSRFEKIKFEEPKKSGEHFAALQAFQSECQDRYLDTSSFSSHFCGCLFFQTRWRDPFFSDSPFWAPDVGQESLNFAGSNSWSDPVTPMHASSNGKKWRFFGVSILKTIIHLPRVRPKWIPSVNNWTLTRRMFFQMLQSVPYRWKTGAKRSKQIVTISTWCPKFSIKTAGQCVSSLKANPRQWDDLISTHSYFQPKHLSLAKGVFKNLTCDLVTPKKNWSLVPRALWLSLCSLCSFRKSALNWATCDVIACWGGRGVSGTTEWTD